MASVNASVVKFNGFYALRKATTASKSQCTGAQIAPVDRNLEIIRRLMKKDRLIVMGEMDGEDLLTMEDVNEAVKTFNCHKAWKTMSQIKERMMALEEIVNKSLADSAR